MERTKPNYQTFGPADGTGRTWHDYFREAKGRDVVVDPVDEPDDDLLESFAGVTITVPAHEVTEGWPRALGTWRNRLLANGWEVKVGTAETNWPTTYAKNGNVKKKEHDVVVWWLNGAKPGRYVTIAYEFVNGTAVGNHTTRMIRGQYRLLSDAEMKDAVEADD